MIDVTHQISTVRREVGRRTLEAGEARSVTLSQTYATDIDDLWDACTSAERIPRWFLPVRGDLRLHGRYQLEGNAGGEILTCDPPRGFTATWEYGDEVTWIEVRLTAEGPGSTRFELVHIAHVDNEKWAEFGPGALGVGWDLALIGLGLHLASGAQVDPAEFATWSARAEGREFAARSSEGWCAAAIAAGEDPETSRAAADRTTSAYTATEPPTGG